MLACCTFALVIAAPWSRTLGLLASFGLYGFMHSSTVVLALRDRNPVTVKLVFVAVSVLLSMGAVWLGFLVSRVLGDQFGIRTPAVSLVFTSGLGALCYLALIRTFWARHLPAAALIAIPLCCASATLAALELSSFLHAASRLWFAMIWWYVFSIALRHFDQCGGRNEGEHVWDA